MVTQGVSGGQNFFPLPVCELVCRDSTLSSCFASIGLHRVALTPALHGPGREFKDLAGLSQACPGGAALID